VVFTLSMVAPWLFLLAFPIRLPRNAVIHTTLFSALVAVDAGKVWVRQLLGRPVSDYFAIGGGSLCLLGWLLFFGAKGERTETVVLPRSPENTVRLRTQLMDFDQSLARVARQPR
jgi:hypothetical protein